MHEFLTLLETTWQPSAAFRPASGTNRDLKSVADEINDRRTKDQPEGTVLIAILNLLIFTLRGKLSDYHHPGKHPLWRNNKLKGVS